MEEEGEKGRREPGNRIHRLLQTFHTQGQCKEHILTPDAVLLDELGDRDPQHGDRRLQLSQFIP